MVVEALVPPGAGSSRRDSRRNSRRNSVHKCPETAPRGPILPFVYTIAIPRPPTTQAHGATVYTNAPKRLRGAISADLCTLLRRRRGGETHVTGGDDATTYPHELTKPQFLAVKCRSNKTPTRSHGSGIGFWSRGADLNHRPPGYERVGGRFTANPANPQRSRYAPDLWFF